MLKFLQNQKLLTLASYDEEVWIANVYYVCVDRFLYFISDSNTKHSKQILKNPKIAFTVVWFNKNDFNDRKSVQGVGTCTIVPEDEALVKYGEKFGTRIDRSTFIESNFKFWKIDPSYIKYWDDELLGKEGTHELTL